MHPLLSLIVSSMTILIMLSLLFRFSKGAERVINSGSHGVSVIVRDLEVEPQ
jgi:hypothetical protein